MKVCEEPGAFAETDYGKRPREKQNLQTISTYSLDCYLVDRFYTTTGLKESASPKTIRNEVEHEQSTGKPSADREKVAVQLFD